jgi:alpha-glucosidase (family GH31 glycosyl hydrolase)
VFPDFFSPVGVDFWGKGLEALNQKTKFDGIWLDMNEVTSLCVDAGECPDNIPSNAEEA